MIMLHAVKHAAAPYPPNYSTALQYVPHTRRIVGLHRPSADRILTTYFVLPLVVVAFRFLWLLLPLLLLLLPLLLLLLLLLPLWVGVFSGGLDLGGPGGSVPRGTVRCYQPVRRCARPHGGRGQHDPYAPGRVPP